MKLNENYTDIINEFQYELENIIVEAHRIINTIEPQMQQSSSDAQPLVERTEEKYENVMSKLFGGKD